MKQSITLAVEDFVLYEDDASKDFSIVELWFLSDGNNTHHCPISLDVLKKYSSSALGKFIVGKYSQWFKDVEGHEHDQQIFGYIPPNGKIEYKQKDGKTFATVKGVISKLYCTFIYDMFKEDNHRSVSCEFIADMEDENEFGDTPIIKFDICGITILGKNKNPSCAGADIKVIQFSEDDAQKYYDVKINENNTISKFIKERNKLNFAESYTVNKSELKDISWGDVDKTELRNKIMEASNKNTLVHDVYMLVEDGWENAPSEHLKYPVMAPIDGVFYYIRGGLSSALGYAKAENETSVISKVEKIYNKFNLEFENKDGEKVKDEKKMDDAAKLEEEKKKSEEMAAKEDEKDGSDEDKKMSDEPKKDEDKKMSDGETKKFSLDCNVDVAAFIKLLEMETANEKRLIYDESNGLVMLSEMVGLIKEKNEKIAELTKFQDEVLKKETEMKLEAILNKVKPIFTEDEIKKFSDEAQSVTYNEIESYEKTIKSLAFEKMLEKEANKEKETEEDILKMGFDSTGNKNSERTVEDVWNSIKLTEEN